MKPYIQAKLRKVTTSITEDAAALANNQEDGTLANYKGADLTQYRCLYPSIRPSVCLFVRLCRAYLNLESALDEPT